MALRLATRAYILESGRISASGSTEQLQQNESVRRLYLGA
jgi:ABC-type lipopolysaccharide export system ATPase subunit